MFTKGKIAAAVGGALMLTGGLSAAQADTFHGGYVGGQLVIVDYDFDVDPGPSLSDTDVGIGGVIGTGTTENNYYLGVELDFWLDQADDSTTWNGVDYDVDVKHSYGVNLRLGRVFNDDWLVYGLLGYQGTKAKVSADGLGSDSETYEGGRGGVGVEYQLENRMFFRGEYSQTFHGDETVLGGVDVDPDSWQVKGAIGYRF